MKMSGLTASNFNVTNASSADISALNTALSYLNSSENGASTMQNAANAGATININHNQNDSFDPNTNTIN
jgi:hypothetical protein